MWHRGVMKPEELFERLLGLGDSWEVVSTQYKEEGGLFEIHLRETEKLCKRVGVRPTNNK